MNDILHQLKQQHIGFDDPLLGCLVILTQLNEHPFSAEALKSGLPLVENRFTPQLFVRAAQRAGFSAKIVQRPLNGISKLVLPTVLILKDNQACIINKIDAKGKIEIILPEADGGAKKVSKKDLEENYTGYAIFTEPVYKFEQRADEYKTAKKKSWFWGTIWQYKNIYGQVLLAAFLVNLFALAMPMFIMNVYDRVVPNFAVETLWVLALGVFLVIGFDLLLRSLRGYLIDISGKKADTVLASSLFQQIMNIKMAAKPASSGAFASNIREFEVLRDFFTSATMTTLVDLPFIFVFILVIWMIAGKLAIIPLLAVPIVLISAICLEIPIRRAVEKSVFGSAQKHAMLIETINNLETIKSLSAEGHLQRKWERFVGIASKASLKSRFFSTLAINFTVFTQQLVTVSIIVFGVYLIHDNALTMGGLIATVILTGRALAPLAQIAGITMRFNQSKLALQNLTKVMELPIERPEDRDFLHRPVFKKEIKFKNVAFAYPDQEQNALNDVNCAIKAGEHVAILGRMGSGKSTLQKLCIRLFDPTDGNIYVDGTDITQIDPADLRRQIGYVEQDYPLFYGTVRENITMGAPNADDEAILYAAKLAGVDSFISKHPAGYDMPIGELGRGLSGGQKQSIAIARALLMNPSILVMDEPTSSIDTNAEMNLIKKLKVFTANKTLILVTHKTSMLELVDRIIILDNGKIVADGAKDKVLEALKQQAASVSIHASAQQN